MNSRGSLASDTIKLTLSKMVASGLMMVSAMLLARIRTLQENGIYSQLLLVINLFAAIFMMGLPNSINYFLAKAETKKEKNYFLSVFLTINTILSLLIGFILWAILPLLEMYFSNSLLSQYGFFLVLFPWAKVIGSNMENMLIVLKRTDIMLKCRIANSILLLIIVIFVGIFKTTFRFYMLLYLLVEGGFAFGVYFFANKYTGKIHFKLDKKLLRKILIFSIPLGLASIVGTLNIEMDKLMLGHWMSTEQLAIYTNASKELPLNMIATSFTAVLLPQLVHFLNKGDTNKALFIWKETTIVSFTIMSYFAIGLSTFASEALSILYSEKYISGTLVFIVYSLMLLTKCTYFGIILNSLAKTKLIFFSAIGSLILNVVLNVLFYILFGMVGPAIATFISSITMSLFQLFCTSKLLNVNFKEIFPWKECLLLLIINLLLGMCFRVTYEKINAGIYSAVILAIVWGIFYMFLIRKFFMEHWRILKKVR